MKTEQNKVGLYDNLKKLSSNQLSQFSFNKLIEKIVQIGVQFLTKKNHYNYYKSNKRNEDIYSLVIEAITPLFIKNKNEEYPIVKSFNTWNPKINTDSEALYFIMKIVAKRVEQYSYHLKKQEDPLFGKILDSVNYLIIKNNYHKIQIFGKTYISKKAESSINKSIISNEELMKIPFQNQINIEHLIISIFNYIKYETSYSLIIPFFELITFIKSNKYREIRLHSNKYEELSTDILTIEVNIEKIIKKSNKKLVSSYWKKSKLSSYELYSIQKVLIDITNDMKNGGISSSYFNYLNSYFTELSYSEYRNKYRNIIEYMVQYLKNELHKSIKNDELNSAKS